MRPLAFLRLLTFWSLCYYAAWFACAAVVFPACILCCGLSLRAGFAALWAVPHLFLVTLVATPSCIVVFGLFSSINTYLQLRLRRNRQAAQPAVAVDRPASRLYAVLLLGPPRASRGRPQSVVRHVPHA